MKSWLVLVFLIFAFVGPVALPASAIESTRARVGSKTFTENYILAEILAQTFESVDTPVQRRFGLGGTGILYRSLIEGEIDVYPEYTGTISETILKNRNIKSVEAIRKALAPHGLVISEPLGFNNTYAMALRGEFARRHGLTKVSDLGRVPQVRAAFSHEFMRRPDGYPGMLRHYGMTLGQARSIEHSLAYEALARSEIDLTDVYSTDAKIAKLDLVVLEDDRRFFPEYQAVILARRAFVDRNPQAWSAVRELAGRFSARRMIALNALADIEKKSFSAAANEFLRDGAIEDGVGAGETVMERVWLRTKQHVVLVLVSVTFAILVGIPFGVLASRSAWLGQTILVLSGIVQTIPSLALLCFLIPLFGIGTKPALVALFLYGLLPIVMGTYSGLQSIDKRLVESARALGLSAWQSLRLVELPLASRSIVGGLKTSAVISVGTATLAALIGAGGYGAPIVTGLALNDINTILIGAIPAAGMSLVVHLFFEAMTPVLVPRGLRLK